MEMRFNGIVLLLLTYYLFVPTLARNLDIAQRNFAQSEDASKDLASKKQELILFSAEVDLVKRTSASPVLGREEIGDKENPYSLVAGLDHILLREAESFLHDDDENITSLLEQNGLPIGLLPSSVASYSITDGGEFTVSLQEACYVQFDYKVYYAETITGKLSYGTITNLSGIQAKQFFLWVSVTGIHTDTSSSDYIYFDVGPISKKLSISQFETVPVCTAKAMA